MQKCFPDTSKNDYDDDVRMDHSRTEKEEEMRREMNVIVMMAKSGTRGPFDECEREEMENERKSRGENGYWREVMMDSWQHHSPPRQEKEYHFLSSRYLEPQQKG